MINNTSPDRVCLKTKICTYVTCLVVSTLGLAAAAADAEVDGDAALDPVGDFEVPLLLAAEAAGDLVL